MSEEMLLDSGEEGADSTMYESRWATFLPLKLCAEVMVMGDETIVDGML